MKKLIEEYKLNVEVLKKSNMNQLSHNDRLITKGEIKALESIIGRWERLDIRGIILVDGEIFNAAMELLQKSNINPAMTLLKKSII